MGACPARDRKSKSLVCSYNLLEREALTYIEDTVPSRLLVAFNLTFADVPKNN